MDQNNPQNQPPQPSAPVGTPPPDPMQQTSAPTAPFSQTPPMAQQTPAPSDPMSMANSMLTSQPTPSTAVPPTTPPQEPPPALFNGSANGNTEHKGGILKWIIILLVIVAVGLGGFLLYSMFMTNSSTTQQTAVVSPSPRPVTPTPDPMAGWLTYSSSSAGFSFQYPPTVTFGIGQSYIGTNRIQQTPIELMSQGGTLSILPNYGGRGVTPIKTEAITIGGIETSKFYSATNSGVIKAVTTPSGDELFFTFTLPTDATAAATVDEIFNEILATLEFTPQASPTGTMNDAMKQSVSPTKSTVNPAQ